MSNRNVVLLGFIIKAAEYLKEEFRKSGKIEELRKLEALNLDQLKEDLLVKVYGSIGENDQKIESLINTGENAFDEYAGKKAEVIIGEFTKIFECAGFDDNEVELPNESHVFGDENDELLRMIFEATTKVANQENIKSSSNIPKPSSLDDLYSEILAKEKEPKEEVTVYYNDPEVIDSVYTNVSDEYVNNLISNIRSKYQKTKTNEQIKEESSTLEKISSLYPYLSRGFIKAVYDQKESINDDYPQNASIILLHRVYFDDVDNLRQFVEIVSNHDYNVNVDESRLLVDVFKQHVNTDGKILANIYEIANQVKVLNGEYEGYRVDIIDGRR